MKLNRRELLKLLGKVTAVSGIAAAVGLPEVSENTPTIMGLDEYARLMGFHIPPGFPNDVYPIAMSNNENVFIGLDEYIQTGLHPHKSVV